MSYLLPSLKTKPEVDNVIKSTEDLVLVLNQTSRYDECLYSDPPITELDNLAKCAPELAQMASTYLVDVDAVPAYIRYFDISLIPATIFFFNGQHMKVDWGRPDHTKFIGSFKTKQDFIDVVETLYRAALKGKVMARSPLDPANVPKYDLIYKDI